MALVTLHGPHRPDGNTYLDLRTLRAGSGDLPQLADLLEPEGAP